MGNEGILAFIRNLEILSLAEIELETRQLAGLACCNFSEDLSPRVELVCSRALHCMAFLSWWLHSVLLTLWNSFAKQCLKFLASRSIKILYEDLEQGLAFTRIAWPSFLSFNCYANESVGHRCDLQAPTQQESPASELDLLHLKRKRGPVQAEGAMEFRKPSRTPIIVPRCKRSQFSCDKWPGGRFCTTRIAEIEEASWNEQQLRRKREAHDRVTLAAEKPCVTLLQ